MGLETVVLGSDPAALGPRAARERHFGGDRSGSGHGAGVQVPQVGRTASTYQEEQTSPNVPMVKMVQEWPEINSSTWGWWHRSPSLQQRPDAL